MRAHLWRKHKIREQIEFAFPEQRQTKEKEE